MRIVHVVQRFTPALGGTEAHVRALAERQAARGHEVVVATSAHSDAPTKETLQAPAGATYRVARFAARHWRGDYLFPPWLPMDGLEDFLVETKPDLYHAHGYRFATIETAARASRRTGRPFVVTAHGFYPPENPLVALARWRYDRARGGPALRAAARVVAVTVHEADHYESLGVPLERIDVVPNGLPEEAFDRGDGAAFRGAHGVEGVPLVVFLARLAHDKGLSDLVRAMAEVRATIPDAVLLACGPDAGARKPAQRLARRLGIAESVRFAGRVEDARDAYDAADVFALPSHYEAFGIVLAEAMAQGTPVVTTTAGGIPDVVGDAAVLVPPKRPQDLAIAVASLLSDPAYARVIGGRGPARARKFLWDQVVARLEETYLRALRT